MVILIIFIQKAYNKESRQVSTQATSNIIFVLQKYNHKTYNYYIYYKKPYYIIEKYWKKFLHFKKKYKKDNNYKYRYNNINEKNKND